MPKISQKVFVLLFLMGAGLIANPALAKEEGIRLVTGDDYPPFTSQELKDGGLATKIVKRAFEIADYPVQDILWQPWARGYSLTLAGAIDGAFPWGPTPKRLNEFYFSKPIMHMTNYAYVNVNSGYHINSFDDIKGKRYCNPNGYGDFGIVKRYREAGILDREEPLTMVHCFKMLALNRVDFVVAPTWDAEFGIKGAGLDPYQVHREELVMAETPLGLIVSRKNVKGEEIIEAFDRGLDILRETGEFEAIYKEFSYPMTFEPSVQ